ncbi:MAG: hypothetical protein L0Z50_37615 [Verrucomicrobiales bacterium]|nr:hypothetical protein [Verrucomicrobiales bacterium]
MNLILFNNLLQACDVNPEMVKKLSKPGELFTGVAIHNDPARCAHPFKPRFDWGDEITLRFGQEGVEFPKGLIGEIERQTRQLFGRLRLRASRPYGLVRS